MSREEHRQRHVELHRALDELIADWLMHSPPHPDAWFPSSRSITELMRWSHQQTIEPEEPPGCTGQTAGDTEEES